ncbi:MAG: hypothetical protein WCP31_07700 [Chloroflexales bacterium]
MDDADADWLDALTEEIRRATTTRLHAFLLQETRYPENLALALDSLKPNELRILVNLFTRITADRLA